MADVNLSVEVQSRGANEATQSIRQLESVSRLASTALKDLAKAQDAMKTAGASVSSTITNESKAVDGLKTHVNSLKTAYTQLGVVMAGATATERLKAWGGTLDGGIARARQLQQQMDSLNADPLRDLMAVEQARSSRMSAQMGVEKARWNASLQGMTAAQRAAAVLTRAENEHAVASERLARAQAKTWGARDSKGRFKAQDDAAIRAETAALKEYERTLREVTSARAASDAIMSRAQGGLKSAQAGLAAARWNAELAAMQPVEAAQARLTRSTRELAQAERLLEATTRATARDGSVENMQRKEFATRRVTQALNEQRSAQQGLASAQRSSDHDFNSDNAFQSSYSYFILAGLAQQASQRLVELGTASVTASREIERGFADVERTFEGTGSQLGSLRKRLYELSTETPVSIIDLSHIAALGNQLGIAEAHIESFTQTIAQYSAVSGVSAEDAATAFGRISNLTGIAASEYDKLASSITYTARTTVATESTIQSTAKEITALASGAGLSASAIVGLAGALSSLAIPPERARGALSLYFGALNTAVSQGGPKLKAFADLTNMTTQELDNLVRSNQGEKVFTAFIDGMSKLDTVAKTDALKTLGLGTIRVDQTMRALAQNVPLVTKSLEGAHASYAAGTDLMRQYGIIQDTLDSKIKQFQNSIQNGAAALGDNGGLASILKVLLDGGTKLIVWLTEIAGSPLGQAFMVWATAAVALAAGLSALIGVLALTKASMVVLTFAMRQLDWHHATSGLRLWTANMLLGAGAARTNAAATGAAAVSGTALAGSSRAAASGQLTFAAAAKQSAAATFTAANGMRLLGAAANIVLPILALTLITAGIQKLAAEADKAANPVKALGADVESLKQALMDDNIQLMAKGIDGAGAGASKAHSELSDFNQSVLQAIDIQRDAEKQIGKTNSALTGQEFALGSGADAWIDEALKSSDAIKSLMQERSTWGNIVNLGMSAKMTADMNPGRLVNGMLAADQVVSSDEFYALMEAGMPIKELSVVAAEHGAEAARVRSKEWLEGFKKKNADNPGLIDAAERFELGVMPNLLKGVEDGFKKARVEAALARTQINDAGENVATSAADFMELKSAADAAGSEVAFTFEGATDRLDDFRNAIQGAMQEMVGFDSVFQKAGETLKALTGDDKAAFGNGSVLPNVEVAAFGQALNESIAEAQSFYTNITALADTGSTMFALQLAELGPEASGILAGALELDGAGQAKLEESARLAAFMASDAFKNALQSQMADSNEAYALIFSKTGDISQVQSYIAAQVAGTGAEWERQWAMNHPDLPLNVDLRGLDPGLLKTWADTNSGALIITPTVKPGASSLADAMATDGDWIRYLDSATGATITLPANLDDATLTASLEIWRANQNASPKELAAKLEQAGLTSSLAGWVSSQPAIQLRAAVTPYLTQTLGDIALRGVVKVGGGRTGGLIDRQRYGDDKFPRFATGGGYKVTGPGSGISDSILARLSAGEYVNTKKSVDFWGADFFDSLNRRMLPGSMMKLLGAAAVSGNQGPSSVTNVSVVQNSPVSRDPLKQLREDSERVAAGIWG